MKIEVAKRLVRLNWPESIHKEVKYPEEDLFLEIYDLEGRCLLSRKVNFLNQTEETLEPGKYQAKLLRKKRLKLSLLSGFHYTPKAVLVSENERRHHLTLTEIDWENLRRDVELGAGLKFGEEVAPYLRIKRHPEPELNFPEEEWLISKFLRECLTASVHFITDLQTRY